MSRYFYTLLALSHLKNETCNLFFFIKLYGEWLKQRFMVNGAFIIEGLLQSLPQSIIQCIAMIYYRDYTSIIALVSIVHKYSFNGQLFHHI